MLAGGWHAKYENWANKPQDDRVEEYRRLVRLALLLCGWAPGPACVCRVDRGTEARQYD